MVWRLLFDVVEIGVELWALTIDRIRGEVEKHQATNGERDERGKLRVKMVWVKFWICDLCIQICSDGFCSDGFCSDVGGVFCSDGFLKINANDGFCVCFAMRHGLMSFMCVLQWLWVWLWVWIRPWLFLFSFLGGVGFVTDVVMVVGGWEREKNRETENKYEEEERRERDFLYYFNIL